MDETKRESQPTYEELLEFRKKHLGWQQEYLLLESRRETAQEERKANLSRTWTGRLVLLVRELDIDWVAVFTFAVLMSVNFWLFLGLVCAVLSP